MKLVFIIGKKRSGKDTAVEILESSYKTRYYKLAGPIKEALAHSYYTLNFCNYINRSFSNDDWDGRGVDRELPLPLNNQDVWELMKTSIEYLKTKHGLQNLLSTHPEDIKNVVLNNTEAWSIRRLMQTLGTDVVCNKFDSMFWVKLFALNFADTFQGKEELFIVPDTRQPFELAYARAMGATVIQVVRDGAGGNDTHSTEAGLPIGPNDIVITNNGTLEEFKNKLIEAIETL